MQLPVGVRQFFGGLGNLFFHVAAPPGQTLGHAVKALPQLFQFIPGFDVYPGIQVALADFIGHVFQLFKGFDLRTAYRYNDVQTSSMIYDAGAGSWTDTYSYNGVSTSETGAYSSEAAMTYSFVKDGTYSSTESYTSQIVETETDPNGTDDFFQVVTTVVTTTDQVESNTTTGAWSFMGKNKSAELKANERIALTYLSGISESTITTTEVITVVDNISGASTTETFIDVENDNDDYTYGSTDVDEIWKITESKNKSLKVEFTADYTSSSSSSSSSTSDGTTTTYTSTGTDNVTGSGTIEMTQD